jgi:heme/copper-type cytochrome/quinol oxidase subunit 2
MRIVLGLFVIITATFFSTSRAMPGTSAQSPEGVQVIEVTAKKYEFNPSPIRVKQGTRVQLKITATDHAHGFKIKPYPEGANPTDSPGLILSSAQSCERIEKHQTATIEFVAKAAGTYRFKCCTICGWHHRSMKGELIVEP